MGQRPSHMLGMDPTSYRAYCLDEAVIFFGMRVEAELEEAAEGKKSKEQRAAESRQQKVFDRIFGKQEGQGSGFADPALMFN